MEGPHIGIAANNQKFIDALNDAIIEVMAAAQEQIERTQPRRKPGTTQPESQIILMGGRRSEKEIIGYKNGKIRHVKQKRI